jgi:hypothetical protein
MWTVTVTVTVTCDCDRLGLVWVWFGLVWKRCNVNEMVTYDDIVYRTTQITLHQIVHSKRSALRCSVSLAVTAIDLFAIAQAV